MADPGLAEVVAIDRAYVYGRVEVGKYEVRELSVARIRKKSLQTSRRQLSHKGPSMSDAYRPPALWLRRIGVPAHNEFASASCEPFGALVDAAIENTDARSLGDRPRLEAAGIDAVHATSAKMLPVGAMKRSPGHSLPVDDPSAKLTRTVSSSTGAPSECRGSSSLEQRGALSRRVRRDCRQSGSE